MALSSPGVLKTTRMYRLGTGMIMTMALMFMPNGHGSKVPMNGVMEELNCQHGCPSPHFQTRGGDLTITIVEATGLPDLDGWGLAGGNTDAYVKVSIGASVQQTDPVLNSNNPVWPEGGQDLWFGARVSGTPVRFDVYDFDDGLEFGDDYITTGVSHVLDCSCFSSDFGEHAMCDKTECIEEAWVPLAEDANCTGRSSWPWSRDADVKAMCLRVRMRVVPFRVDVLAVTNPLTSALVTTVGVNSIESGTRTPGNWGRPFDGSDTPIDPSFAHYGGLMIQTDPDDKDDPTQGTYMTIKPNLDCVIYVYRKIDEYGNKPGTSLYRPDWLRDGATWKEHNSPLILYNVDVNNDPTNQYKAMSALINANEEFELGFPKAGVVGLASMESMYIIVLEFFEHVDDDGNIFSTTFDENGDFFPMVIQLGIVLAVFGTLIVPQLRKSHWRVDRLESLVLDKASRGSEKHLLALVLAEVYNNGSKANIDFRHNLYYIVWGARMVIAVPTLSLISWGLAISTKVKPHSAGLAILFCGLAFMSLSWGVLIWRAGGWRMTTNLMCIFTSVMVWLYLFLFLSTCLDMRIREAGMPHSLFCVTCVAFAANIVPLVGLLFLGDDGLHDAFVQLQKVVDKNRRMNAMKNKFQALGTMGLKMALLNASQNQDPSSAEGKEKKSFNRSFGTLLGSVFTVDDSISAFRYSDILRRVFTKKRKARVKLMWSLYFVCLSILLVYSIMVYVLCDPGVRAQGLGLSFAVFVLDVSVFLLQRGPCTWGTGQYIFLSFAGRASLCFWVGEWWIVGIGLAYFIYGVSLGKEIINQRMRTLSVARAGAVAYFGREQKNPRNRNDVSASPEFVLGYLSAMFLVSLLAFVFNVDEEEMPSVPIAGQSWDVWIFGVAAFVIVIVCVVLGMAYRALMLQRKRLMDTKAYFFYRWFDLPLQLVALAELFVVMSALLFYAITSSEIIFVTTVFLPLIMGSGFRVYTQWLANDFNFLQPVHKRLEDEDESSDDDDDDQDAEEGMKTTPRDGDDDSDDDEDEKDGKQALMSKLKDKALDFASLTKASKRSGPGKIKMPTLPFRKPMNLATKKVSRKEGSKDEEDDMDIDEDGEDHETDSVQNDHKDEDNENDHREGDDGLLETSTKEAREGQASNDETSPPVHSVVDDGKEANDEKAPMPDLHGADAEKPDTHRRFHFRANLKPIITMYDASSRLKARLKRKKELAETRVRQALGFTGEEDPTKMNAIEAYWKGRLTETDYTVINASTVFVLLMFLYGQIVSLTESEYAWLGQLAWAGSLLLIASFMPVRKYYGTQTVTQDMIVSLGLALFVEVVGGAFLFVYVLGANVNDPTTVWLFLFMVGWPSFLAGLVAVLVWRDNDWKLDDFGKRIIPRILGFVLFCATCVMIWGSTRKSGIIAYIFWGILFGTFHLLRCWSENEFFLSHRVRGVVRVVMACFAIGAFGLGVINTKNEDRFFWITIGFFCLSIRLIVQVGTIVGALPVGMPIFYSLYVFPIYVLEPRRNDLVPLNELGFWIYLLMGLFYGWGVCTIVFVDPLEIGIGITSFGLVGGLTLTSYFISRTPIWLAAATLCVDEKEIKVTAQQARGVFEKRRKTLEVKCEEYVKKDEEEAALQRKLNRYANLNQNRRTKLVEFEKRYTAEEMANAVSTASRRLRVSRNGKPRKDGPFTIKDAISSAFHNGRGPLAPLLFGGAIFELYEMYKHPATERANKKKKEKYGLLGLKVDDEDDSDLLDRLVEVLGPGGDVLHIVVYDYDATSLDDVLGKVEIHLDDLTPEQTRKRWYPLEDHKPGGGKAKATGELQLGVEIRNVWGDLQVKVDILRGKGLRAADAGGTSDPYCVVKCGTYQRRTAIVYKTVDPDWRKTKGKGRFVFPPVDDTLIIEVKDHDMFGTSDSLGGVDIVLTSLRAEKEYVKWYPLEGGHGKTRATGEIKVALQLSKPVTEYGLVKSQAALSVTIVEAKGLRAADRGGTSDPFCVCKCGLDAFKTSIVNKSLNPTWEEEYTFNAKALVDTNETEPNGGSDDAERLELLDSWKVYLQLPKLDLALAREYYEESRGASLFQMLLVVTSKGRISREAILFQRFLREFRFKLLANGIEPPRTIFRSKSWATVDVGLVALWLLRLSHEQRERFHGLRTKFAEEVAASEEKRMKDDAQLKEHAEKLYEWLQYRDYQMALARWDTFQERRQKRLERGEDGGDEPEEVINAKEMLLEIENGKDCVPGDGIGNGSTVFQDPEFPASQASIAGVAGENMIVGWKRSKAINMNASLFAGGTDPDDVFQGILHDGWFLSAISILAASGSVGDDSVDPLVDNLFITKEKSPKGAYAVRFYKNAQWEAVIVDDQFPVLDEKFKETKCAGVACSYSANFSEMWVSILEKAYAKYYGGYAMLENGYVHHALTALTGAHSEQIFLVSETQGSAKLRLWKKLLRYSKNGFLMGCGTISNDAANAEQLDSGLVFGACYAIFQVVVADGHKLLQLRNPPGDHGEWKGDWGDNSELWTTRLKKKLGWTAKNDGTFWMSFDDFLLSFRNLYVCHYYRPDRWTKIKLSGRWEENTAAGLPCMHNPDCKLERNPQWVFEVELPVDIHIKVTQSEHGYPTNSPQSFSALLIQSEFSPQQVRTVTRLSTRTIVEWTGDPDRALEKHIYATLEPRHYVLLLATYTRDMYGPFEIEIDVSAPITVEQLYPTPEKQEKENDQPKTKTSKLVRKLEHRFEQTKTKFNNYLQSKFGSIEIQDLLDDDAKTTGANPDNNLEDLHSLDNAAKEAKQAIEQAVVDKSSPLEASHQGPNGKNTSKTEHDQASSSPWIKQYDPNSQQHYYWNKQTGVSQWEIPDGFMEGGRDERLDAATKIQAQFRGAKSRKSLLA